LILSVEATPHIRGHDDLDETHVADMADLNEAESEE